MEFKKERAVVRAHFFQNLRTQFTPPVGTYDFFDHVLNECAPTDKVYLSCEIEEEEDSGSSIDLSEESDSEASVDASDSEEEEQYYIECVDELRRMKRGNSFVVPDPKKNKKQKRI